MTNTIETKQDLGQIIQDACSTEPFEIVNATEFHPSILGNTGPLYNKNVLQSVKPDTDPGYGANNGMITWSVDDKQYVVLGALNPGLYDTLQESGLPEGKWVPYSNDGGLMAKIMKENGGKGSSIKYVTQVGDLISEYYAHN